MLAFPAAFKKSESEVRMADEHSRAWTNLEDPVALDALAGDLAEEDEEDETVFALRLPSTACLQRAASCADGIPARLASPARLFLPPPDSPPPASPTRPPNAA